VVSVKPLADGNSGSSVSGAAVWSRGCSPPSKGKSVSYFVGGILIGALLASTGFALFLRGQKAGGRSAQQMVLKLGHGLDTGHPVHKAMEFMKQRLKELSGNTVTMDMMKVMGAAPTPIAWGELYSALAQGTVDGAENNLPSFVSNKHYEVCKHFTLDGHARINFLHNDAATGSGIRVKLSLRRTLRFRCSTPDGPIYSGRSGSSVIPSVCSS
jgi:hypothetical protein